MGAIARLGGVLGAFGLLVFIGGCAVDVSNPPFEDQDGDGVTPALGDCDDTNPAVSSADGDSDCDGVPTEGDCDDYDPESFSRAEDVDCDGVVTDDDCDDRDAGLMAVVDDGDCDGALTDDDCDDGDAGLMAVVDDGDCDGILTFNDCDDGDPGSTAVGDDGDCDGVLTADDCDDGDAALLAVGDDRDCDGVLTADDCDDGDAALLAVGDDRDCDGVPTADDCDDGDAALLAVGDDRDCDGVLTADDCDDGDAALLAVGDDRDCDGVLTADDCDDGDWEVGPRLSSGGCTVRVMGGSFDMGCTPGQSSCAYDESPVRATTLTRDYYMSRTEVTQLEFFAVMGYNPSLFSSCGWTCPVEYVTWHEAAAFANAVSTDAGLARCYACTGSGTSVSCSVASVYSCTGYRLPTEAEWEGAARCGQDLLYAGSATIDAVAWYIGNSSVRTREVAGRGANACGLYDMSGNVYEWTNDWYEAYASGAVSDPSGPASGSDRVFRGGSWSGGPQNARVANRSSSTPGLRSSAIGFRLLRTAP